VSSVVDEVVELPCPPEPSEQRLGLRVADPAVRRATLKHAGDIAAPIYQSWRRDLKKQGVTWQVYQVAASANHRAWEQWVEGTLSWRHAVQLLLDRINTQISDRLILS